MSDNYVARNGVGDVRDTTDPESAHFDSHSLTQSEIEQYLKQYGMESDQEGDESDYVDSDTEELAAPSDDDLIAGLGSLSTAGLANLEKRVDDLVLAYQRAEEDLAECEETQHDNKNKSDTTIHALQSKVVDMRRQLRECQRELQNTRASDDQKISQLQAKLLQLRVRTKLGELNTP